MSIFLVETPGFDLNDIMPYYFGITIADAGAELALESFRTIHKEEQKKNPIVVSPENILSDEYIKIKRNIDETIKEILTIVKEEKAKNPNLTEEKVLQSADVKKTKEIVSDANELYKNKLKEMLPKELEKIYAAHPKDLIIVIATEEKDGCKKMQIACKNKKIVDRLDSHFCVRNSGFYETQSEFDYLGTINKTKLKEKLSQKHIANAIQNERPHITEYKSIEECAELLKKILSPNIVLPEERNEIEAFNRYPLTDTENISDGYPVMSGLINNIELKLAKSLLYCSSEAVITAALEYSRNIRDIQFNSRTIDYYIQQDAQKNIDKLISEIDISRENGTYDGKNILKKRNKEFYKVETA